MKISEAERLAIISVVEAGKAHGFYNLICHLQTAWARMLMEKYGLSEEAARVGALGDGYPFLMQEDLMERGEWDETGHRYAAEAK